MLNRQSIQSFDPEFLIKAAASFILVSLGYVFIYKRNDLMTAVTNTVTRARGAAANLMEITPLQRLRNSFTQFKPVPVSPSPVPYRTVQASLTPLFGDEKLEEKKVEVEPLALNSEVEPTPLPTKDLELERKPTPPPSDASTTEEDITRIGSPFEELEADKSTPSTNNGAKETPAFRPR